MWINGYGNTTGGELDTQPLLDFLENKDILNADRCIKSKNMLVNKSKYNDY